MVHVRRYTPADAQACSRLVESAVATMIDANDAARELIRAHAAPGLLDTELAGCHAVVAEDPRGVLGMAVLAGTEIRRVYVRADMQRSGIGRALMTALEHEAMRRMYEEIHLTAGAAAAAFYERLGYERLETGEFVDGEARVPFVYMRKRLGGAEIAAEP